MAGKAKAIKDHTSSKKSNLTMDVVGFVTLDLTCCLLMARSLCQIRSRAVIDQIMAVKVWLGSFVGWPTIIYMYSIRLSLPIRHNGHRKRLFVHQILYSNSSAPPPLSLLASEDQTRAIHSLPEPSSVSHRFIYTTLTRSSLNDQGK